MKNYLFSLILLISASLFSQQGDILGETWYLESVLSDGVTYERPLSHDALSNSFFSEEKMYSTMCETGGIIVNLILDQTNSEFTITGIFVDDGTCTGESAEFRDVYYDFFDDTGASVNYSIDGYSLKTLTLEKNGDILTYKNHLNLPPAILIVEFWSLERLTVDGIDYEVPLNSELNEVNLFIEWDGYFETSVCTSLLGMMDFYSEENLFIQEMAQTMINCGLSENMDFEVKYTDFFWNNIENPFEYVFTDNGDASYSLLLIDTEGNEALYGYYYFGTKDSNKTEVQVYPNPVSNILTVKTNQIKPINIKITDLTGRLVLTGSSVAGNLQIDLSSLPKGVYIALTEMDGRVINSQKIIKK